MSNDWEIDAIADAVKRYPEESCGLVVSQGRKLKYCACANTAENKLDNYVISPVDWQKAEDSGEVIFFVHSHPDHTTLPSELDMSVMRALGIDMVIIGVEDGRYTDTRLIECPDKTDDIYGRPFLHGVRDCYTFVRLFYQKEFGIKLGDYAREDEWWDKGLNLYEDNYQNEGFVEVKDGSLNYGDLLLMSILSPTINHASVYLGDGMIGHHLYGMLSEKTVYRQFYRDRTRKVLRHVTKTSDSTLRTS